MQINVVKDPSGKVIATYENAAANSATVQPVLPAGHKLEKLEVANDYAAKLHTLYT